MRRFFAGPGFAVFTVATVVLYTLLLAALFVWPAEAGGFAGDFKAWCFGFDPATGHSSLAAVAETMGGPIFVGAIVALLWRQPLADVFRRPRGLVVPVVSAVAVVALAGVGLAASRPRPQPVDRTFPAARLRTAVPAPRIALVDQEGVPVALEALRGRVVMVTAVYSRCGTTCPMILAQAKRVLSGLDDAQRADLSVLAIMLDPAHDGPAELPALARAQGVASPLWRLASGPPPDVEAALDAFGISRWRDEETGIIEHQALTILVDRGGRVAYRFTVGDLQEAWLSQALRLLLAEPLL
jgi:protein SCO1/2